MTTTELCRAVCSSRPAGQNGVDGTQFFNQQEFEEKAFIHFYVVFYINLLSKPNKYPPEEVFFFRLIPLTKQCINNH